MKWTMAAEGGAIRTVFSCGVMDALLEAGFLPDRFVGTSAGIAYGVSYISRQRGRNLEILERYVHDSRYMGWRNLFRPGNRSYYGLRFVFQEIPEKWIPFDFDCFAAYSGEVLAVVTDVHTGQPQYLPVPRRDASFSVLQASCALPLLFPMIEIDGHLYLDGGITDPVPYRKAMEGGYEKCIVILTRESGYRKTHSGGEAAASRLYFRYSRLAEALRRRASVYNQQRQEIEDWERQGKLLVLRPESTQGFGRLEKDLEKIRLLYQQGYQIAWKRMDDIAAYLQHPTSLESRQSP